MVDCNAIMRNYSKYMLVVFNFFFVLTGIIIISVGVSAKVYYGEFTHLLNEKYFYVSDLLIVIGAIIFMIAFVGCCGAVKENACMTNLFSILLIIIIVLEACAGISGVLLKHKTEEFLENRLEETMKLYNQNKSQEITDAWDTVQTQMHCCGVLNYTDWYNTTNTSNPSLPMSCCEIPHGTTGNFVCNSTSPTLYKEGCLLMFGDKIRENTSSIEIVGFTLAIIQLLGIALSCYLSKQIRSDYETV